MSFFMIHKILKKNGYNSLMDLLKDCMQIFWNACEYNIETSAYYVAAKKLEALALKKAVELQPTIDLTIFEKKPVVHVVTSPKNKSTPKVKSVKIKSEDSSSDEKVIFDMDFLEPFLGFIHSAAIQKEMDSQETASDFYRNVCRTFGCSRKAGKEEHGRTYATLPAKTCCLLGSPL